MSSDLSVDSCYDSLSELYLAPPLNRSDWNGCQITWRDVPEIRSEIERRILDIYISGNYVLAHQLATFYLEQIDSRYEIRQVKSSKKNILTSGLPLDKFFKETDDRALLEAQWALYKAGMIKDQPPPLEPILPTNYPTLWAWQTYRLENGISLSPSKHHSGGFKEFWHEHKKAIIIAAVVIAVAVGVVVVIVTTAGTGTSVAVATGAAAVQAAIDDYNSSENTDPNGQNLQHESVVSDGIQNFAQGIGATEVDNTDGPITILETSSIPPEITPEILTGLVTSWNANLPLPKTVVGAPAYDGPSFLKDGHTMSDPPASPFLDQYEAFLDNLKLDKRKEQEADWQQTLVAQRAQQIISSGRRPESGEKYSNLATYGNFTSGYESPPPFSEVKLIGKEGLSTIHYHCGINNTSFEVKEAGYCLNANLDENYAIQPHWLHKDSLTHGLTMVGLEGLSKEGSDLIHTLSPSMGVPFTEYRVAIEKGAQLALEHTKIQNSINYEVEFLSDVARQIIDKGNNKIKQVHATFSNGGYVFKKALEQLPPEYRDTIVVITCGTTEIIEDGLAHKVYNVIGDKDWPSKVCNGGMNGIEKAGEHADVDIIEQNETKVGVGGHYIMQPDYQKAIKYFLDIKVAPNYEIY